MRFERDAMAVETEYLQRAERSRKRASRPDIARTLHVFDNNRQLFEACESYSAYDFAKNGRKWIDGMTKEQCEQWAKYGCDAIVPAILPLLDKFDHDLATPAYEWQSDVTGAFVNIGDYLAGDPQCMQGMHWDQSNLGTLNIGVCLETGCRACMNLNCLCSPVDAASYKIKGAAIMAFAAKMAAVRPVNLVALHCSHGYVQGRAFGEGEYRSAHPGIYYTRQCDLYDSVNILGVRVSTSPLDVGAAGFALCNIGFGRAMMYGLQVHAQKSSLSWVGGCDRPGLTFPALTADRPEADVLRDRQRYLSAGRPERAERVAPRYRTNHQDPSGYANGIMRALQWDPRESLIIPATQDASLADFDSAVAWVKAQIERFNPTA